MKDVRAPLALRIMSRTFWLAAIWTGLSAAGLILQWPQTDRILTVAGAVCGAFVALEKLADRDERRYLMANVRSELSVHPERTSR